MLTALGHQPHTRRAVVATAALLLSAATAHAPLGAQTTHFGAGARAAFLAAAVTPVGNDLDAGGPTYSFGALGSGTVLGLTVGGTSGTAIAATGRGGATPAYSITFTSRLGGFGADFSSIDFGTDPFPTGTAQFRFFDGATAVGTVLQSFGTSGGPAFFDATGPAASDRVERDGNVVARRRRTPLTA